MCRKVCILHNYMQWPGSATMCPILDCRRDKAAFDLRDLSAFTRDARHAQIVMAVPSLLYCTKY